MKISWYCAPLPANEGCDSLQGGLEAVRQRMWFRATLARIKLSISQVSVLVLLHARRQGGSGLFTAGSQLQALAFPLIWLPACLLIVAERCYAYERFVLRRRLAQTMTRGIHRTVLPAWFHMSVTVWGGLAGRRFVRGAARISNNWAPSHVRTSCLIWFLFR